MWCPDCERDTSYKKWCCCPQHYAIWLSSLDYRDGVTDAAKTVSNLHDIGVTSANYKDIIKSEADFDILNKAFESVADRKPRVKKANTKK